MFVGLLVTFPSPEVKRWGYIRLGCTTTSAGHFALWDLQVWGMGKAYLRRFEELGCGTSNTAGFEIYSIKTLSLVQDFIQTID